MKIIFFLFLFLTGIVFGISCKKENNSTTPATGGEYDVFVWNDPGMHCPDPFYDECVYDYNKNIVRS